MTDIKTDPKLRKIAQQIASHPVFSLGTKEKMLQHLLDGKPPFYAEAELDSLWGNIFIGFAPDPDVNLSAYINGGAPVTPRLELPSDQKALSYTNTTRQLLGAARLMHLLPHFYVERQTEWWKGKCEVCWYSYFNDEVSLRIVDDTSWSFVVVGRKELLDGSFNPRFIKAYSTGVNT